MSLDVLSVQWLMDRKPAPEPAWLVKRMIPEKGIGLLSAKWGEGKTYTAIDLALSICAGEPFAGRRTKSAGVLYLAVERGDEMHRRAHFAATQRGLPNPPLLWVGSVPKLTDRNALYILIATAKMADQEIFKKCGGRLGIIIVDTLVVVAGWEDENKSAEVQAVLQVLRALSEQMNCFVLATDHLGKDNDRGTRGSSDKELSTDVVLTIKGGTMTLKKCSSGPQEIEFGFKLKVHDLGQDADGDPITECTVEWLGEGQAGRSTQTVLSHSLAVREAMQKVDMVSAIHVDGREVQGVLREHVRENYLQGKKGTGDAKRKAWSRAYNDAVNSGEVKRFQDYLYLANGGL